MIFSSAEFIFLFLPGTLLLYYFPLFRNRRFRNVLLVLASLFFYAWGEPVRVVLLLASIVFNWLLGDRIADIYLHHPGEDGVTCLSVVDWFKDTCESLCTDELPGRVKLKETKATRVMAEDLNQRYGLGLDSGRLAEERFTRRVWEDVFLGSLGRKSSLSAARPEDYYAGSSSGGTAGI